jgi:hypothetical protein
MGEERWFGKKYNAAPKTNMKNKMLKKKFGRYKNAEKALSPY